MITIEQDNEKMIASIYGEIDHHTAREIREEIDARISRAQPKELIFDFSHVTFMDSSGIGLIMGRYKLLNSFEGRLCVFAPSESIRRILRLSGIERLAEIRG